MSKQEYRDKKRTAMQERKIEDLRNGVPSQAGRVTKEIISGIGAAAAAGLGVKKLLQKNTRQQQNSNDMKKGGVVKSKKKQIKVKTIKKK